MSLASEQTLLYYIIHLPNMLTIELSFAICTYLGRLLKEQLRSISAEGEKSKHKVGNNWEPLQRLLLSYPVCLLIRLCKVEPILLSCPRASSNSCNVGTWTSRAFLYSLSVPTLSSWSEKPVRKESELQFPPPITLMTRKPIYVIVSVVYVLKESYIYHLQQEGSILRGWQLFLAVELIQQLWRKPDVNFIYVYHILLQFMLILLSLIYTFNTLYYVDSNVPLCHGADTSVTDGDSPHTLY
jgi:hypothetical protein